MIRVTINDSPIPDGYTYKRCDRYTAAEILARFISPAGKVAPEAEQYLRDNPKDEYTIDDILAIKEQRANNRATPHGVHYSGIVGNYRTRGAQSYDSYNGCFDNSITGE